MSPLSHIGRRGRRSWAVLDMGGVNQEHEPAPESPLPLGSWTDSLGKGGRDKMDEWAGTHRVGRTDEESDRRGDVCDAHPGGVVSRVVPEDGAADPGDEAAPHRR